MKRLSEINSYLKHFYMQKNIEHILDNSKITDKYLGVKKLHLIQRGNSVLANSFLRFLRSSLMKPLILKPLLKTKSMVSLIFKILFALIILILSKYCIILSKLLILTVQQIFVKRI